eukprot:TRINITY_DN7836_c1_g1_i1.p1 TRINITY_DN7836_c1_g1~~TRINITY_DN7836_c1_g1_i1.p1  ORF type:complete len:186 (+),score=21.12 TRINITY_DN7836_c1_g1_i1:29-586(+)
MLRRTTICLPSGGPYNWAAKPRTYGPGRKWTAIPVDQIGPALKDHTSVTERGWVMKMLYMLQPITFADLWEEIFRSPYNPVHTRMQLRKIIKHMRKDLQLYYRMDTDDLQFYLYLYPHWSRMTKHFVELEKKVNHEEEAKLALNPPPPYSPNPPRYYIQYLTIQKQIAERRIEELKLSKKVIDVA